MREPDAVERPLSRAPDNVERGLSTGVSDDVERGPSGGVSDNVERGLSGGFSDAGPTPDLTEAAAAAGLLDVAYAMLDSPVGSLLVVATPAGLVRIAYVDESPPETVLADVSRRISPRVLAAPRRLDVARRELDEYFGGQRERFELALDWRLMSAFGRRVLAATAAIPYGAVSTYREVAIGAGSPGGFRATGNALGANPLPIVLPCHRVVSSGGGLGGYTGGVARKRALLRIEGRELPVSAS